MGSSWYYLENDNRIGPVEHGEIERLVSHGTITAQTLVWCNGMDGWEEAGRHFKVAGSVGVPPPAPSSRAPITGDAVSSERPVGGEASGSGTNGLYPNAPARGFGEAISVCFNKYVTFSGRASRSEYWYFVLFSFLIGLATVVVDMAIFGTDNDLSPINTLASLALLLPSLSAGVRRLHDTNRSGWWIGGFYIGLVGFIGVIGIIAAANPYADDVIFGFFAVFGIGALIYSIVLVVFFCQRGSPGPNRFG